MKPESKFFLMKMLKSLSDDKTSLQLSIIEIRAKFGVTSSVIKSTSDYLDTH
ncbi:hypothetical protein [Shewanella frigidimarina]|uniref:hypothetical protein n=1 Tax=Shewanella frigidimarina TaxID=56812 RepID=UPI003D7BBD6C